MIIWAASLARPTVQMDGDTQFSTFADFHARQALPQHPQVEIDEAMIDEVLESFQIAYMLVRPTG